MENENEKTAAQAKHLKADQLRDQISKAKNYIEDTEKLNLVPNREPRVLIQTYDADNEKTKSAILEGPENLDLVIYINKYILAKVKNQLADLEKEYKDLLK